MQPGGQDDTVEHQTGATTSIHDFSWPSKSHSTSPTSSKEQSDEEGSPANLSVSSEPAKQEEDPNLITWDGPDDKKNPKNWPRHRKVLATAIVSLFALTTSATASAVAPALPALQRDLNIRSDTAAYLIFSMPAIGFIVGALPAGPLSELYGRARTLQISFVLFIAFNIGCGFVMTKEQIYVLRFLNGLFGVAPATIGAGTVSDCYEAEEIGRGSAFYGLAPRLGPAIGPLLSGFIVQYLSWRWIFYISSIGSAALFAISLLVIEETRADVLLRRKAKKLCKTTGNSSFHTKTWPSQESACSKLFHSLWRPIKFLATQPILQYLALYQAFLTGLLYLILAGYHSLWTDRYGETISISGLNYIAIGLGLVIGNSATTTLSDKLYNYLIHRYGYENDPSGSHPELRVPLMLIGAVVLPCGILLYGWTAQYHIFWLVPNIGIFLVAVGIIIGTQGIKLYSIDTYRIYAASATGAINLTRSVGAAVLPLFAPQLISSLNYNFSSTLLAGIAILFGIPGPLALWYFGPRMRRRASAVIAEAMENS